MVGLGNPGADYRDTRHNLGFRVVDRLSRRLGAGAAGELCGALVSEAGETLLARPQTYMNRSGWAVRCLVDRFALQMADCLVVYDEIALPLRRLRLRPKGSPAGHRGMESIAEALQSAEIPRLRIGIAPPGGAPASDDLAPFVLAPFAPDELVAAEAAVELAAEAAFCWLNEGIEAAMARFNGAAADPDAPLARGDAME